MENKKAKKIFERSKSFLNNNEKIKTLMHSVREKIMDMRHDGEEKNAFIENIRMVMRMIQAHFNGTYSSFSTRSILLLIFSLVYFITPVDMIPDIVPVLGFTDDISVLYFVLQSLATDIEKYREWEEAQ